jgi:uncharacterized protein YodC (DUF2158 family)
MAFAKGKRVTIVSGGPVMTMESLDAFTDKVTCIWFDDSKLMRAEFDLETLREYREPSFEPDDTEYDPFSGGRSRHTGY